MIFGNYLFHDSPFMMSFTTKSLIYIFVIFTLYTTENSYSLGILSGTVLGFMQFYLFDDVEKISMFCVTLQVYITSGHEHNPSSPIEKEVDFFRDAEEKFNSNLVPINEGSMLSESEPVPISNGSSVKSQQVPEEDGEGPSVEAALSMSPTQAVMHAEPRKPTIGTRKPTSAKKGVSNIIFTSFYVETNF